MSKSFENFISMSMELNQKLDNILLEVVKVKMEFGRMTTILLQEIMKEKEDERKEKKEEENEEEKKEEEKKEDEKKEEEKKDEEKKEESKKESKKEKKEEKKEEKDEEKEEEEKKENLKEEDEKKDEEKKEEEKKDENDENIQIEKKNDSISDDESTVSPASSEAMSPTFVRTQYSNQVSNNTVNSTLFGIETIESRTVRNVSSLMGSYRFGMTSIGLSTRKVRLNDKDDAIENVERKEEKKEEEKKEETEEEKNLKEMKEEEKKEEEKENKKEEEKENCEEIDENIEIEKKKGGEKDEDKKDKKMEEKDEKEDEEDEKKKISRLLNEFLIGKEELGKEELEKLDRIVAIQLITELRKVLMTENVNLEKCLAITGIDSKKLWILKMASLPLKIHDLFISVLRSVKRGNGYSLSKEIMKYMAVKQEKKLEWSLQVFLDRRQTAFVALNSIFVEFDDEKKNETKADDKTDNMKYDNKKDE
ncbi:unnamed protein product [Caenorhabditis angaria]|uniref:Uncharacterized protein n=1 Tax=Caenorhabditis angaria TaxID=860376 RepID=A0A9P1IEX3_9PELO|nr:unnamed protein product [Caenorhabditis angaria]